MSYLKNSEWYNLNKRNYSVSVVSPLPPPQPGDTITILGKPFVAWKEQQLEAMTPEQRFKNGKWETVQSQRLRAEISALKVTIQESYKKTSVFDGTWWLRGWRVLGITDDGMVKLSNFYRVPLNCVAVLEARKSA